MEALRQNLFKLAFEWRRNFPQAQICALTGSSGKTSTKEILHFILKSYGKTIASVENYNTKPALAGDVFKLKEETQFGVFEVGLRKPEDLVIPLKFLCPQVVACLNVGSAHLEFFKDEDELVKEKCRIFSICEETHTVIIPDFDPRIYSWAEKSGRTIVTFGRSSKANIKIVGYDFDLSKQQTLVILEIDGLRYCFKVSGLHQKIAEQVAAAVGFCKALELNLDAIPRDLCFNPSVRQRFEISQYEDLTVIDDSFNANPDSMKASLETVSRLFGAKKKLFVLGSMLELGEKAPEKHKEVLDTLHLQMGPNDQVVLIGEEWKREALKNLDSSAQISWVLTSKDFHFGPSELKNQFEVIFLKGSKAHNLGQLKELF